MTCLRMKVFVVYVVMLTSRAWINHSLWTCRLSSHNSSPSIETSLVLMIYLPWRRSAISGYEALSLQCKNRNILPKNRHFPLIMFFFWTLPDNKPNGIKKHCYFQFFSRFYLQDTVRLFMVQYYYSLRSIVCFCVSVRIILFSLFSCSYDSSCLAYG